MASASSLSWPTVTRVVRAGGALEGVEGVVVIVGGGAARPTSKNDARAVVGGCEEEDVVDSRICGDCPTETRVVTPPARS